MSKASRAVLVAAAACVASCGSAQQVEGTTVVAQEQVAVNDGAAGVLVAPQWGQGQSIAAMGPVYTDPGEIPRLRVAGDEGERLPLEHTHVEARLTGFIAEVEVRQTYQNPHAEPIEAIYIFPLPENSAVNHMRMEIGDRVVEAEIRRREEARREYEAARREGFTAALLEQERPNVFTQSVANIAPGESIDVVVRYVQDLTYDAGQYEFVFPMVVGPRFIPGQELAGEDEGEGTYADTDQVPDASRITPPYLGRGQRSGHDISLNVVADATLAVGDIEVPTHEVLVQTQTDDGKVRISLPERESIPNRDFVLRYRATTQQPRATLFLSNADGGGHFSLAVHPPTLDVDELVGRREIIFVVDVSGSMSGTPLSLCRVAMRDALRRLRPVDTFNIITFAGRTTTAFERPRPANDANLRLAFQVVDEMRAGGGTYMANAIGAALSPEVEQGRHRYVFFMTDGYVGNEDAIIGGARAFVQALEARQQRARVFGFGVGSSVNRHLLDGLSEAGEGVTVYATNREVPARAVNQFFRYIDHAVLEGLALEWADLGQQEVVPAELPDLFASHAMILHGSYERPPTGALTVTAQAGGRQVRIPVTVRPVEVEGEPSTVLGSLWARARVDDLEERLRSGEQVSEQITALGLEHRLVTRFTSFVAVDRSRRVGQGDPRQIVQPVETPEGVDPAMAGARVAAPPPSPAQAPRPVRVSRSQARMPMAEASAAPARSMRGRRPRARRPAGPRSAASAAAPSAGGDVDALLSGAVGAGRSSASPTKSAGRAVPTDRADSGAPPAMTRAMIRREIRRQRAAFLRCYEQGLARTPALQGRIVLRFQIAPDGRVQSPAIASATLQDPGVHQCVTGVAARMRFPAHAGASAQTLTFPLIFSPDPDRPGRGAMR